MSPHWPFLVTDPVAAKTAIVFATSLMFLVAMRLCYANCRDIAPAVVLGISTAGLLCAMLVAMWKTRQFSALLVLIPVLVPLGLPGFPFLFRAVRRTLYLLAGGKPPEEEANTPLSTSSRAPGKTMPGSPWTCTACKTENRPEEPVCVECGCIRHDPQGNATIGLSGSSAGLA